jgi:hypothetical protein
MHVLKKQCRNYGETWLSSGMLRLISLMMAAVSMSETSVSFYNTTSQQTATIFMLVSPRTQSLKFYLTYLFDSMAMRRSLLRSELINSQLLESLH